MRPGNSPPLPTWAPVHPQTKSQKRAAAPAPLVVPMLLFGIDMTEVERTAMRQTATLRGLPDRTEALFQQESEQAAKRAVIPRNRLRR